MGLKRFGSISQAVDWLRNKRVIIEPPYITLGLGEKYGLRVWGAIDYLLSSDKIFSINWRR